MLVKRKPNDLIPKFLNKFDDFSKDVQTRLKLSAMLNEFNDKLNKKFLSFVYLSNSRYKSVKSGNALDTILYDQKNKYNLIADQIMSDDFYHNDDIQNEKDKIEKNINNKKTSDEIKEIRDRIKQSAQDMLSSSNKKKIRNKTTSIGYKTSYTTKTNRHHGYGAMNTRREITGINNANANLSLNQGKDSVSFAEDDKEKRIMNHNAKFINELIKEDEKIVSTEINDYVRQLDLVKREVDKGEDKKIIKMLNENKKFFITDKIKMLNYLEEERDNVIKRKPKDISIDIKKVMKYTKRGKRMKWGVDYSGKQKSSTSTNKDAMTTTNYATSYNPNVRTEISDTLNLVKSEAENCLFIDEKFYQKRNQLNKYISDDDTIALPQIANTEQNMPSCTFGTFKSKNLTTFGNNNKSNQTHRIGQGGNKKNIGETFKTIYNEKAQEWKKEESEKEELDKIKAEELKHTYNFLKEVKNQPRQTQLYVDGYSHRNKANEQIIEFSNALGRDFYNKKKLNKEIDHFINEKETYRMELEEEMKQKHDELIREAELEAEKKKEVFEKFKKKIRNENINENDSIKLGDKDEVINPNKKFNPSSTGYDETDNEYEKFLQFKQVFINKMEKMKRNEDKEGNKRLDDDDMNGSSSRRNNRLVTYLDKPKNTNVLNLDQEQLIKTLKKQLTKMPESKFTKGSGEGKRGIEFKKPNPITCNYINYKHLNNN